MILSYDKKKSKKVYNKNDSLVFFNWIK